MSLNLRLLALSSAVCLAAVAQEPAVKHVPAPYIQPTSGEKVYETYCASCHGAKGQGDGPAARAMKATLPDLTTLAKRNQGQYPAGSVGCVIRGKASSPAHSDLEMPDWGQIFRSVDSRNEGATNIRVHNLVKQIESLQVK